MLVGGRVRYVDPPGTRPLVGNAEPDEPIPAERERTRPAAIPLDPAHVAAARELRDRYLEQFNEGAAGMLMGGKYDVGRCLPPLDMPQARELIGPRAA